MSFRCLIATLITVMGCLLAGDALAVKPLIDLKLVWRPSKTHADLGKNDVTPLSQARIKVMPLADRRPVPNPGEIGESRENESKGEILSVLTNDSVPAFCTEHLGDLLRGLHLQVVDDSPSVVITGEVLSFYVIEKDGYDGTVTFKLHAAEASGKALWSGTVSGKAHCKGRSYKADKYFEALSDSLSDAVVRLVNEPGFRDAVSQSR
jgi:hypothetical protein